ncbi:MAG TPA: ribonuclease domain-containing protein [Saprospiraceae bacterium]|nr:ribonuclease domain-containing protein [Saprospiraceae bacterium]
MKLSQVVLAVLIILLLGGILMYSNHKNKVETKHNSTELPELELPKQTVQENQSIKLKDRKIGVPGYVYTILEFIDEHGVAPEGYVGGRRFQNREKRLSQTDDNGDKILYQEWDVHEKIEGQNRGAERLVTGSNHSAYYTKDHYKNFIKIR